jgi:hypothetical protein
MPAKKFCGRPDMTLTKKGIMMSTTNKGGRPSSGIDADFIHGVTRRVYVKGLVRGGTREADIHMSSDKIERYSQMSKPLVRDVLEVLIERGILTAADMQPLKEDVERFNTEEDLVKAGIPATNEQIREILKSRDGGNNKKDKKRVSGGDAENTAELKQTTRTRERERVIRER